MLHRDYQCGHGRHYEEQLPIEVPLGGDGSLLERVTPQSQDYVIGVVSPDKSLLPTKGTPRAPKDRGYDIGRTDPEGEKHKVQGICPGWTGALLLESIYFSAPEK